MPSFRYQGYDDSGAKVSGVIQASSAEDAQVELRDRRILVAKLNSEAGVYDWRVALGLPSPSPGLAELEFLTAELALLLDNGVRIDRAIAILARAGKSGAMSEVLTRLLTDLNQGKQLSDCLKEFPDLFDRLYVNLVALGEAGGRLPEVFRGLAEELRFRRELREKVISAVTYPAVIVGVCIISIYFILNFVVPNLAGLFSGVTDLPWYTAMLLSSSEIARDWQLPILMALVLSGLWLWRTRKSPYVSGVFERIMLEWPGLRYATVSVERVRFSSGLAMMLDAGLPVDRALSLAAGNVERAVIQRELFDAVERIKRGEQISSALGRTRLFPEYLVSLLEVGEESGALARVFAEIARRGRNDFSAWALRLTTLLEPIMILVMGGIVGGVVVIMMLSITSVTEVGF